MNEEGNGEEQRRKRRMETGEEEEAEVGLEMLKQTAFKSKQNELAVWRAVETIVCDKLK